MVVRRGAARGVCRSTDDIRKTRELWDKGGPPGWRRDSRSQVELDDRERPADSRRAAGLGRGTYLDWAAATIWTGPRPLLDWAAARGKEEGLAGL